MNASPAPRSFDHQGKEALLGMFATHVNGNLDPREIVEVLPDNKIAIMLINTPLEVPAENYYVDEPATWGRAG